MAVPPSLAAWLMADGPRVPCSSGDGWLQRVLCVRGLQAPQQPRTRLHRRVLGGAVGPSACGQRLNDGVKVSVCGGSGGRAGT